MEGPDPNKNDGVMIMCDQCNVWEHSTCRGFYPTKKKRKSSCDISAQQQHQHLNLIPMNFRYEKKFILFSVTKPFFL